MYHYSITTYATVLLLALCFTACLAQEPQRVKTRVIKFGLVDSFNVPNNSAVVQLTRFSAWWLNNQFDILPDVRIEVEEKNSGAVAAPSVAVVNAVDVIKENNLTGIIGGLYSANNRVVQYVASAFGLPHITGSSSLPTLSNKAEYPTFLRTCPSDSLLTKILVDTLERMGFKNAVVAVESSDWGLSNLDLLQSYAITKGITITGVLCSPGTFVFDEQAARIKEGGWNAILLYLNFRENFSFLHAANKTGLFGPNYVWMLSLPATQVITSTGALENTVVALRATGYDVYGLRKLLDGAIAFAPKGSVGPFFDDVIYPLWMQPEIISMFPVRRPISSYSWYGWDVLFLYAKSIDNMMKRGVSFESATRNPALLLAELKKANFTGVTGLITLDQYGDRIALMDLYTVTEASYALKQDVDPVTDKVTTYAPFVFFGGSTEIPKDAWLVCGTCVHGSCVQRKCICTPGFRGDACDVEIDQNSYLEIILPVVLGVLVIALISGYFLYRHKHKLLVKDISDRQQSELKRSEIMLGRIIGHGASGEVYSGQFRGTEVAVKRITSKGTLSQTAQQEFKLESAIMCSLRHPNIVLFMGSCYEPSQHEMLLVMEYMKKGTLHSVLHNPSIALPFTLQIHLAYQAAQGLNFLHQCSPSIIHCDIKSHNVLLDDKWCARISDFGITKISKISKTTVSASDLKTSGDQSRHSLGTIFWAAPEVLSGHPHTNKSDCYSFGIVLWELFHRKDPYGNADPLHVALQVAKRGIRPEMSPAVPNKVADLIKRCWDQDPLARPTMEQITIELRQIIMESDGGNKMGSIDAHTGTVFFVSTEVEAAAEIWDEHPQDMMHAMILHNEVIRKNIEKYNGHEVSYQDEKFLLTFSNVDDAINWCITTQNALIDAEWSHALDSYAPTLLKRSSKTGKLLWSGLRVRMGVHKGTPTCNRDQYSDKMVYEGPVKDVSGSIIENVPGGIILVTKAVHSVLDLRNRTYCEEIEATEHTEVHIKDSKKKEMTYIVYPTALYERISEVGTPGRKSFNIDDEDNLHTLIDIVENGEPDPSEAKISFRAHSATKSQPLKPRNSPVFKWDIPYTDITLKDKIGKTPANEVYMATLRGSDVAVKQYFNTSFAESLILELKYIISMASKLNHPNIVKYFGFSKNGKQYAIVQEYMGAGSLQLYLSKGSINMAEKYKIAYQIACGMDYLSKLKDPVFSIHRSLKSNNIMMGKNFEIKVSDYGLSGLYDVLRTLTSVESVAWTAPEILSGSPATSASVVYSFGILLWEIYMQKVPYQNVHPIKLISQVMDGERPPVPDDCPTKYAQLMKKCWTPFPENRPNWSEIIYALQ